MTAIERHIAGNLRWLTNGQVLASWKLEPLQRPSNERDAAAVARAHRELFRAIAGHRFWLESLLTWTDPWEIANAMIDGIDLEEHPAWAETTDAAIDMLNGEGLGSRHHLLTVKLNLPTVLMIKSSALAAANDQIEKMGMSVIAPDEKLMAAAQAQANTIERALPAAMAPRPLTPVEIVWSRRHAAARDGSDLVAPDEAQIAEELRLASPSLGSIHLDPNGIATESPIRKGTAPVRNRWVAVSDDRGATSYQAGMVIADIPRTMQWPDTEFLGRIDDCGVPVDLTISGVVRTSAMATRKAQHAMHQLGDQINQITTDSGDGVQQASHQVRLNDATQIAMDYTADLTRDRTLVEVEPVIYVSVAADSPEQAETMAQAYIDADVNRELGIARPIGQEAAMFWARQPGGSPSMELNAYRQLSHSGGGIGQSAIVTASKLGDDTGIPLAINHGSSLRSLVYLEPFGKGSEYKKKSPSMATVGDQGGGKTSFSKTFAGHMADRGARVICTDTSQEGEWVTFMKSLDADLAVVEFENPTCSIDPLRTLPANLAAPVMQSFLSTLLDIDATGEQGRTLAKVLKTSYLAEHGIDSAGALVTHLARMKTTSAKWDIDPKIARVLADRVAVFADVDTAGSGGIAQVLFDSTLPPLDLSRQLQVWRMSSLQLPSERELDNVKLFEQMSIDKRLGRAVYALYARHAREVCLAEKNVPSLQNTDEFHHMNTSPEAMRAHDEFLRLGRHSLAFWHAQSQLPRDFMGLGDLVRTRLVLRLSTDAAAIDGAAFLGKVAPEDPSKETSEDAAERYQLVDLIQTHCADGDGLGIMRDHRGRIGAVRTMLPFTQKRRLAADTAAAEVAA